MLCAIIPWDHTCVFAYLHIMEMDEFAQVNYSLKITKDEICWKSFSRLAQTAVQEKKTGKMYGDTVRYHLSKGAVAIYSQHFCTCMIIRY